MEEEKVTISAKEYKELKASQKKLDCLEGAGVENWEWYEDAMEGYEDD